MFYPALQEVAPEELGELAFGRYPAIEALAFVATGLWGEAHQVIERRLRPVEPRKPHDPMLFIEG